MLLRNSRALPGTLGHQVLEQLACTPGGATTSGLAAQAGLGSDGRALTRIGGELRRARERGWADREDRGVRGRRNAVVHTWTITDAGRAHLAASAGRRAPGRRLDPGARARLASGAALPPGPGTKRLVREALETAPDGLTVPEAAGVLGLGTRAAVSAAFLDGLAEGWCERAGWRRGGRNVPMAVYRSAGRQARGPA